VPTNLKETAMKALIATALIAFASPMLAEAPVIDGQWTSVAAENMGQLHATRDFTFDGDAWSITFRAFGDAGMTVPLFTLDVAGYYKIGGPSKDVPGAYNGVFGASDKVLVADSPAAVEMFGQMGCTLEVGVPFDLTDQACGFFHASMDAAGEYDLVALKDGQLFLGDRAGDLTKERPKALTPFPLIKK
jgi:hypothetical protein